MVIFITLQNKEINKNAEKNSNFKLERKHN